MSTLASKLILSLVDRVTAPARGIQSTLSRLRGAALQNQRQMNAMRGRMMAAAGAGYALYRGLLAPTKAAIDFESAMADVRKVVDFPSPKAFRQMGKDIIEMSKRLPMAADGIAAIVAAAGQAKMKGDELLQFAEMAAKVGVAFDMSADEVGTSLAKIKSALELTVEETGELADAINHLSNTTASSAPDLVKFMRQAGPAGKAYGFTGVQTAAFGAAMISAGFEANVAKTSFINMGRALAAGGSATKTQRKAFSKLGLDAKKVAKSLQTNAVGTLDDVLDRIRKLPKEVHAATMSQLFGNEARALLPLLQNTSLLDDALKSVSRRVNFLGSSQKEYEVRAQTTANKMQLFKNQVSALGIAIGAALLPAITDLLKQIGPIVSRIADWAEKNPQLTKTIVAVTASVIALSIASAAAKFALLFVKGGLIDIAAVGVRAAGGLLSLLNPLKLVTSAMRVLRLVVVSTGIGAVLVGIAMAGTWIYNNWSNLSALFQSFGSAFKRAIKPIMPLLRPIGAAGEWIADTWGRLTGKVEGGTSAWHLWGASAGRAVGEALMSVVGFGKRMAASVSQSWNHLSSIFKSQGAVAAAKEAGKMIVSGVSTAMVAGKALLATAWKRTLDFFKVGSSGELLAKASAFVAPMIASLKTRLSAAKSALSAAWQKTLTFLNSGDAGRYAARGFKAALKMGAQAIISGATTLGSAWKTATSFLASTDKTAIVKRSAQKWISATATVLNGANAVLKVAWVNALSFFDELSDGGFSSIGKSAQKVIAKTVTFFSQLPGKITKAVGDMSAIGKAIMDSLLAGLKAGAAAVLNYVANVGSRIKASIKGALAGFKAKIGLGPKVPAPPAIAGARAAGGTVAGGKTYLVGEQGPELFSPPRSGYITPNHELTRGSGKPAAVQPAGQTQRSLKIGSITFGDIILPGVQDAGQVARELGQQLRDELSGLHADSEYSVA